MFKYFFGLVFFISTTCKSQDENYVTNLSGAYSMLSQSLEGSSGDTTFTERKQLKIYTDRYLMYVRLDLEDSLSSFGLGTFSIKKGQLTERIIYSTADSVENTNSFSGTVNISKRLKGYEQVIPQIISEKGKVRLTEDYQLLSAGARSFLDGTWKLTAAYFVKGKDTLNGNVKKYRTYYRGNYSAGSFDTDASGAHHTKVEYGTFRLNGNNKLKESVSYSTQSARKGKSFDVAVVIKTDKMLTLKIIDSFGVEEIEKYVRLK